MMVFSCNSTWLLKNNNPATYNTYFVANVSLAVGGTAQKVLVLVRASKMSKRAFLFMIHFPLSGNFVFHKTELSINRLCVLFKLKWQAPFRLKVSLPY
jgi:hypothetical protein